MRRLLFGSVLLLGASAFAGGRGGGFGGARVDVGLGPAWGSLNQPSWVNGQTTGYPTPLVPITNHTGAGQYPVRSPYGYPQAVPYIYYYPVVQQQQQPAPQPQVIIEREVIVEKAPEPQPAPPPQVIIVQQPAPAPAPVAPPAPVPAPAPEPPKAVTPYTPGPDVYSWKDEDGVVHYSTRPPADGKAKKLATLGK